MGITREIFMEACQQSGNNPTHSRIVQQILSCDDFTAFKRMMIKKNMQINEIAMQELMKMQSQNSVSSQASAPAQERSAFEETASEASLQHQLSGVGANAGAGAGDDMDEQMRIVLEMSRVAQEEQDRAAQEEEEMIRLAIEASQQEEERRLTLVR